MYIQRHQEVSIRNSLANFPVTAIIGPRQCGKSTLARHVMQSTDQPSVYLDLERPSDLEKLREAEWFLSSQRNKLICIDEIQRKPDLFPLIRSLTDEWNRPGCFLLLGSASRDLLRQSSETLAGRIIYKQLTPFLWSETDNISIESFMTRGGFPRSLLASNDELSYVWRTNFISTFLERDLLQWVNFTPATMRRLWQMLAHVNGQTANYSALGNSLGVSNQTVRNYIDLLKSTFMVDVVEPFHSNTGKRLVKSPKVYISDSGIISALLGLKSFNSLAGHPVFGSVWESVVLAELRGNFPEAEIYYYRTSNGAEVDFVVKLYNCLFVVECKASFSPSLSKGNYSAISDINPDYAFVVSPSDSSWNMNECLAVVSLNELLLKIKEYSENISM